MKYIAHLNGDVFELDVAIHGETVTIRHGSASHAVVLDDHKTSIRTAFIDNRRIEFGWSSPDAHAYVIHIDGVEYRVDLQDARARRAAMFRRETRGTDGDCAVHAPIPGLIARVLAAPGDIVRKDQPVLTLDAMKLENEIGAPKDGRLKSIAVQAGMPVEKGQILFVVG